MKNLNGRELADFIKERQAHQVRALTRPPKLLIIRDSNHPVILKYVNLKINYGADIGIAVEDYLASDSADIEAKIQSANHDDTITSIILQLPIAEQTATTALCNLINPQKDVDGLGEHAAFDSATATAVHWLLTGYDIDLAQKNIAIVGRGKLVGAPLYRMWTASNYHVQMFHKGDDLTELKNYNVIITATGVPGLITSEMVSPGAVLVDAGTASEKGVLVGDLADSVRARSDLAAITPRIGGVGPLTITCLFDHVIQSAN